MKKHLTPLAIAVLSVSPMLLGSDATGLPENDTRVVMQVVVPPDFTESASVWDFSDIDYMNNDAVIHFRNSGDTLVSAVLPGVRHDFRRVDDSLYLICSESHFARIEYDRAVEKSVSGAGIKDSFFVSGRTFSSGHLFGSGYGETSVTGRGTIILPMRDTIPDVTLHRTKLRYNILSDSIGNADDSIAMRRTVVRHTWAAPGYALPLAIATETRDTVGNQATSPSISFMLCPPSRQPVTSAFYSRSAAGETPNPSTASASPGHISVTQSFRDVSVSITVEHTCSVNIMVCDIYGIVYLSSSGIVAHAGIELTRSINCSGLPSGEYVVSVSAGDLLKTKKIILR
ncbi:MAG: T9SS type A sorting domain-containing protein [Muribaculum sp.]